MPDGMAASLVEELKGTLNVLLLDDNEDVTWLLGRILSCPLFAIEECNSFRHAQSLVSRHNRVWHCWVFDIMLDGGTTSMSLTESVPDFPYVVMLTGIASAQQISEAAQRALCVVDKDANHIERILEKVCKTAALGFMCGGKALEATALRPLIQKNIADIRGWVEATKMSEAALDRISQEACGLSAARMITLHNALYYVTASQCVQLSPADDGALARDLADHRPALALASTDKVITMWLARQIASEKVRAARSGVHATQP